MFGSIFWQNSPSKGKSFENHFDLSNNFEHYGYSQTKNTPFAGSVSRMDPTTSNTECQFNSSNVNMLTTNFLSSSGFFDNSYKYESYQVTQKNMLVELDFPRSANSDHNFLKNKKNTKQNNIDQFNNSKINNIERTTSISSSVKTFIKQRRFSMRQRQVANQRERDRTHSVNSAFLCLRSMIPTDPIDRKLSKIETLRLAGSYISHLSTILNSPPEFANDKPCLNKYKYVGKRIIFYKYFRIIYLRFLCKDVNGFKDQRDVCTFCLGDRKLSLSQ